MASADARQPGRDALLVAAAAAAGAVLLLLVELLLPPEYVARALLAPAPLPSPAGANALAPGAQADAQLARLYAPDFLLRAVGRGNLAVRSTPVTLPLIGAAVARRHAGPGVAVAPLGLDGFAWGGETLQVGRFDVGAAALGQRFAVRATGDGGFMLLNARGETLCVSQVGPTGCRADGVTLVVSELLARPGTRFWLRRVAPGVAAADLARRIDATSFGASGGLLAIELRGRERRWLERAADAVLAEFVHGQSAPAATRRALERLRARLAEEGKAFAAAQNALEAAGDVEFGSALDGADVRERIATIARLEARRLRAALAADDDLAPLLAPPGDRADDVAVNAGGPAPGGVPDGDADPVQLDLQLARARERLLAEAPRRAVAERELRVQVASERYLALLDVRERARAALPEPDESARIVEPVRVSPALATGQRRLRFAGAGALLATFVALGLLTGRARARRRMAQPAFLTALTGVPVVAVIDASGGAPQRRHKSGAGAASGVAPAGENIGVDSLVTAMALPQRSQPLSEVVAFTALRAPPDDLVRRLADALRARHATPAVVTLEGGQSGRGAGAEPGEVPLAQRVRAGTAAPVLILLPEVSRLAPDALRGLSARILLCVSATRDRGYAVRRAVRRMAGRSAAPHGIVLLREEAGVDPARKRRKKM